MQNRRITWLSAADPPAAFPPVDRAMTDPDGLLAAGGDLSAARLLYAYPRGIFPWYDAGQPILWWSPDPRCVIQPQEFRLARRMDRERRSATLGVTFNRAFRGGDGGLRGASSQARGDLDHRGNANSAYEQLHVLGWAHSVEVWRDRRLVGGIYGLAIGRAFFGESMFSRDTNASKFALHALCVALRARRIRRARLPDRVAASPVARRDHDRRGRISSPALRRFAPRRHPAPTGRASP